MLEAAMDKPEVIEHMLQRLADNGDAQIGHCGKVRQAESAGFVHLAEHDLALRPMKRPPAPDPPLQCPTRKRQDAVPTAQFLEDRDRAKSGRGFQ